MKTNIKLFIIIFLSLFICISNVYWVIKWDRDGQSWYISDDGTVRDNNFNTLWTFDSSNWNFTDTTWSTSNVFSTAGTTLSTHLPWWATFSVTTDGFHGYDMASAWLNLANTAATTWSKSESTQTAITDYNQTVAGMMGVTYDPSVNYAWLHQNNSGGFNYWCSNNSNFMTFTPWILWWWMTCEEKQAMWYKIACGKQIAPNNYTIQPLPWWWAIKPKLPWWWTQTPIITTTTTTASCTYISGWNPDWSTCKVNTPFDTSWKTTCTQTNNRSEVTSVYSWSVVNKYSNWAFITSVPQWSCKPSVSKNPVETVSIPISIDLNNPSTSSTCNWTLYANNNDTCIVVIDILWNIYQNRSIDWNINTWISNIIDNSNEKSNRVDWWWWNALNFSWISNTSITWKSITISWIKSVSPFTSNNWKIEFKLGNNTYEVNNINYHFKKPLTWKLEASIDWWTSWWIIPSLWTQIDYRILYNNPWNINIIYNSITNNDYTISAFNDGLEIQSIEIDESDYSKFSARINTSKKEIDILPDPSIWVKGAYIQYTLWWKTVKYTLSDLELANNTDEFVLTWEEFRWVRVVWNLQGSWKQMLTWQDENISSITMLETRNEIRKNAYMFVKWMNNWDIINGIRYVEWEDVTISWDQNYETLIVKDWNVIIDWDLNTTWKTFWIIVLKNWYNSLTDYVWKWNIYVNNNVVYIDAIIYSDWWFISSLDWNPLIEDTTERTTLLQKQLVFKWSLFTRNTIGWSILSGWYYLLPWSVQTDDFDKAMLYDLNYVRRWKIWWDWSDENLDWNDRNLWNNNPFVIIYNPEIQTKPPKWFKY